MNEYKVWLLHKTLSGEDKQFTMLAMSFEHAEKMIAFQYPSHIIKNIGRVKV